MELSTVKIGAQVSLQVYRNFPMSGFVVRGVKNSVVKEHNWVDRRQGEDESHGLSRRAPVGARADEEREIGEIVREGAIPQ